MMYYSGFICNCSARASFEEVDDEEDDEEQLQMKSIANESTVIVVVFCKDSNSMCPHEDGL